MQRLHHLINHIFLVALLVVTACPAWADWYVNFVHITCIPEARYLAFEAKSIKGSYVLMETEFDEKRRAERLILWRKQGYFEPANLKFECKLPESTYTIIANQPEPSDHGMCGGAPSITLTLLHDGKPFVENMTGLPTQVKQQLLAHIDGNRPFLKDVTFGDDCFGGPAVYRVELSDGLNGWDTRQMTVCTSPGVDQCKFLSDTYGDIIKAIPIDNTKVAEYAKKESN